MKTTFKIILLLIWSHYLSAQNQYKNTNNNYSFTIPSEWKQKSDVDVKDFSKHTGQNYDAIFCPNTHNSSDWGPPLIFSSYSRRKMKQEDYEVTANEFIKLFKRTLVPYALTNFEEIKTIKPGEAYYDKRQKCFVCSYEVDVNGYGKAYYLTIGFFSPNGILSLQFADLQKNFQTSISIFTKLLTSLKK